MESWACEGLLKPYVHYVPVTHETLESQLNWCRNNEDKCIKISKNATNFILQFFDKKNEIELSNSICQKYYENVQFI